MRGVYFSIRLTTVALSTALLWVASASALPREEATVEQLKGRLSSASVNDKAHICVEIAQLRLEETDKSYTAAENEKAQPALTDVVAFSELARDYAIQSRKYQKQTEIAVRHITHRLTDLMHALPREEQGPLQDAITRLQRVRDDLLSAMFPKGAK